MTLNMPIRQKELPPLVEKFSIYNTVNEPGYPNLEEGCYYLLDNWNNIDEEVIKQLEEEGHELLWCDEWTACDNGILYRTEPTHLGWQPRFLITLDNEMFTVEDYLEEVIEAIEFNDGVDFLEEQAKLPTTFFTEKHLEELGFFTLKDRSNLPLFEDVSGFEDTMGNIWVCQYFEAHNFFDIENSKTDKNLWIRCLKEATKTLVVTSPERDWHRTFRGIACGLHMYESISPRPLEDILGLAEFGYSLTKAINDQ